MKTFLGILISVIILLSVGCEDYGTPSTPDFTYCIYDIYQNGILITDDCRICASSYGHDTVFYDNTEVQCTP